MKEEIFNAKIEKTSLGFLEGHYTFSITVIGDGWGQGFGGYALGETYTDYVIKNILETLDVDLWEDLENTFIRIKRENGIIIAIGNLIKDKWFYPKLTLPSKQ